MTFYPGLQRAARPCAPTWRRSGEAEVIRGLAISHAVLASAHIEQRPHMLSHGFLMNWALKVAPRAAEDLAMFVDEGAAARPAKDQPLLTGH